MADKNPVILKLKAGKERIFEPVSLGVPLPKGKYSDVSSLDIFDQNNESMLFAADVLDKWSDGSLKWVLFDFLVSMPPLGEKVLNLSSNGKKTTEGSFLDLTILEEADEFIVKTNHTEFHIDKHRFKPFNAVLINGKRMTGRKTSLTVLTDEKGKQWIPDIHTCCIEKKNSTKATLFFQGCFFDQDVKHDLQFQARITFFAGCSFCSCEFTILNSKAAVHPDGFWDLGSQGSIYFKDLSLELGFESESSCINFWKVEPSSDIASHKENVLIYQDSSGGENWQSENHMNRFQTIPVSFRGYRVLSSGEKISEGLRASPILSLTKDSRTITATLKDFWQNFPSAIESNRRNLKISLFPQQFNDLFELQGGEQKTHQCFFSFSDQSGYDVSLDWVHDPINIKPDAKWYADSKALHFLVPEKELPEEFPYNDVLDLICSAITGDKTFESRREIIDEYGWRNFGDLYADHENRLYRGGKPIISHYNNQYDLLNSFIFQYAGSENEDWFGLARDLARHLTDIDIYHTSQDTDAYNHGLFWHTDHFASAGTATHRSFSKLVVEEDKKYTIEDGVATAYKHFGSGPSPQHLYTLGLVNYYFFTGDENARKGVFELAAFVMGNLRGPSRPIPVLKKIARNTLNWWKDRKNKDAVRPYGLAEGPDRGSANALNVLLDAFMLGKERIYLSRAEYLIKECLHPNDCVDARSLLEINTRWSYTIFLQAVGKYLDLKSELEEFDCMFFYAKEVLIGYAEWMVDNEVPILTLADSFDFPNHATRAANDIRKANVLFIAAKYAPENLRSGFRKKAEYFFKETCKGILAFESKTLTRPLAILMQNVFVSLYFLKNMDEQVKTGEGGTDFGKPTNRKAMGWLVMENFRVLLGLLRSR